MVKLSFNRRNVGFSAIGTIQLEYADWEGDQLASELTMEEAASLYRSLDKAFQIAAKSAEKATKRKGRKNG